jgi:hypothetical protein
MERTAGVRLIKNNESTGETGKRSREIPGDP